MICIHKLGQTDTVNNNNTTEEQKQSNYKKIMKTTLKQNAKTVKGRLLTTNYIAKALAKKTRPCHPILPDNHTLQTFFTTNLSHHQQPVCLPSNLSLFPYLPTFYFLYSGL